jgi:hypothetical protein
MRKVWPDTHRDHVLFDAFAKPHARVEALGGNVGEAMVDEQLDFDVRKIDETRCQSWPQHRFGRTLAARDPHQPGRAVAQFPQGGEFRFDLFETRGHGRQQALAGFRGRHAARGAGQEPVTQPLFQRTHRLAQR